MAASRGTVSAVHLERKMKREGKMHGGNVMGDGVCQKEARQFQNVKREGGGRGKSKKAVTAGGTREM